MTTNGNFTVNSIGTVKIPAVVTAMGNSYVPNSGGSPVGVIQDANNIYYFDMDGIAGGVVTVAPLTDPMNGITHSNALLISPSFDIFSTLIGTKWYGYDNTNSGTIYAANYDTPISWYDTGDNFSNTQMTPMVYYDGSNIYLYGGHNIIFTWSNAISVAAVGAPTTFAVSGNVLPAALHDAPVIAIGSYIYMYGGTLAGNSQSTIFRATTADPTTWTDLGSLLLRPINGAVAYTDGSYVYLYGGNDSTMALTLDTIYRATVAAPTTFTLVGSLPSAITDHKIFTVGNYLYMIGQALGGGTGIMRASTSTPTVWTNINQQGSIATSQASTHLISDSTKIYALGGLNSAGSASTVIQSASKTSPIEWTNEAAVLPAGLYGGQVVKTSLYYYIIGGNGVTGNVYRASLATPTVWTSLGAVGPTYRNGRAMIIDDQVWYVGGENAVPTATNTCWRAQVIDGEIVNWEVMVATLPAALSRFALVQAGNYVYVIGGFVGALASMNTSIYRTSIYNTVFTTWVNVGSITNAAHGAAVAIINNQLYLIGGTTTTNISSADDYVLYASMTDLANGHAIFVEENTAGGAAYSDTKATCVHDVLYLIGGRAATNGTAALQRNIAWANHRLVFPNIPESMASVPSIDLTTGALGSYSSFQKTGILPWLVTDK